MNVPAQNATNTSATGETVKTSPPLMHEADIGSGERTPAQEETDEMIRQIPPLPADKDKAQPDRQQPSQQQQQQQ